LFGALYRRDTCCKKTETIKLNKIEQKIVLSDALEAFLYASGNGA
jgi:hypothetical protein